MNREYRKWWSPALGRDMELLVFGDRGAPVLVFPTSMGRFYQWEDFGIVSHMAPRIDAGWVQLWCVDSVDGESFYNKAATPQDRARRHLAYERYLVDEVLPAIRFANGVDQLIVAGSSFGAFHALAFLPNLNDDRYLAPLRETEIVIATGRDDPNVDETKRLAGVLQQKGVPAELDIWDGWAHDWPYWKDMVDRYI